MKYCLSLAASLIFNVVMSKPELINALLCIRKL
jgi:hypothetical protein